MKNLENRSFKENQIRNNWVFYYSRFKERHNQLSPAVKNSWEKKPGWNYTWKKYCIGNLSQEGGVKYNCISADEKLAFEESIHQIDISGLTLDCITSQMVRHTLKILQQMLQDF